MFPNGKPKSGYGDGDLIEPKRAKYDEDAIMTDRIDKYAKSEFEMIAESSLKPFANQSNNRQNEAYKTDINTTPSSADKLSGSN